MANKSRAMILIALLVCTFLGAGNGAAEAMGDPRPSWFPEISCRDKWNGRDAARYDFKKDTVRSADGNLGYDTYRQRLKAAGIERRRCFKEWTILVYMAGDNDLSPYSLWDVDEMEGRFESGRYAGSTLKSDLLVHLDTAGATGVRRLHVFQRTDQPYKPATSKDEYKNRTPDLIQSPVVQLTPDSSVSASALREFLEWGVQEYPAENYMVIIWGHGQGWTGGPKEPTVASITAGSGELASAIETLEKIPQPLEGRFGGIMVNPATGHGVTIPDLRDALDDTVNGVLEGKRFSVYASDACLMQLAEVAYEISPSTRYIVGSAQVQTFLGLPYRRMMYEINTGRYLGLSTSVGRDDQGLLVAKMLPVLSEQSLDPVRGHQGRAEPKARETFTMSAISSEALRQQLMPAVRDLSQTLTDFLAENPMRAFAFASVLKSAPSFMGGGKELGSFLALVELSRLEWATKEGNESAVSARLGLSIADTKIAIDQTVLERRLGTGYQAQNRQFHLLGYRGIGIWVPNGSREFQERSFDFSRSQFHADTGWQDWLRPALGIR